MNENDLLNTLRPIWLDRAVRSLAPGSLFREDLRTQLDRFFELLIQVIQTGNPEWLDPVIAEWTEAQTKTDLQATKSSLSQFVNELMLVTIASIQTTFAETEALDLIRTVAPLFGYAFQKTAQIETQAKYDFMETELARANMALEQLERTKSDFISVAAHELKTPLTLIGGYASMLRENIESSGMTPYQSALLDGIQHGSERLHMIINDMIDSSMIDNQVLTLNFQPMWIGQLLSILEAELSSTIRERHLKLILHPFPEINEMTFGDPERLMQVFRNVLVNAIKFTPDGGEISLAGRKLPGFIEITISDTGIGIDPDNLNIIFEKFVRLGNTSLHSSGKTKFKGGGPGLGLAIARGIIENHGGTIWVESPGFDEQSYPGSTFHILIPLRSTPPDAKMARLFAPLMEHNSSQEKADQP
jgi:signal transduction histidine kinase